MRPNIVTAKANIEQPMKCRHCGDVIGVYEPVVLLADHQARTTSAAAEPQIVEEPGELFHRACCAGSQTASVTERA